jgi:hypothetical protein
MMTRVKVIPVIKTTLFIIINYSLILPVSIITDNGLTGVKQITNSINLFLNLDGKVEKNLK